MHQGKFIFAQITEFVAWYLFDQCVDRYKGNSKVRQLNCRDQFLAMMFGQLTNLRSLRGIVLCLNAHAKQLYHLGFRTDKFVLSTLTRADENRDWRIYRDLAQLLIKKARKLYLDDHNFDIDLKGALYILDSTVIELCLSVFRWAKFEHDTAAVKIHTQLDLRANIPSFFLITTATVHDVNILDMIEIEVGAYYIMDRGYVDFERLYQVNLAPAFFIIRSKKSLSFIRLYSSKVDKNVGIRCDQIIKLKHFYSSRDYPDKLRRIKYYDAETDRYFVYLTNNLKLKAEVIVKLYKHRWQIELFFKWIKQHLYIQVFWGTSANAVKTQICIAICTFLIIAIMKKQLKLNRNLHEILQILSVCQFEKTPINTVLSEFDPPNFKDQAQKLPFLLDF